MVERWIQTDEIEDVAASIRHVIRVAEFVSEDCQAWKWVTMALHSALQGACVCHLTTTSAPIGAVTRRNAEEWQTFFEESRSDSSATMPKTHLMSLPDLLKAVRTPYSAGDNRNDAGIPISDSELRWLCRFHDNIRNQFVHFEPMGWSIEVSGIPDIAKLVSRIIQEILQVGWAFRHQTISQRNEMQQNLQVLSSMHWQR
ncbi:hypothetical protein D3C80_1268400 [compost metagenome]